MRTDMYWIGGPWAGRLAIAPRPRGGDWLNEEVREWQRAGAQILVSLLTADESAQLGLDEEESECRVRQMEFVSFPVIDRGVPASHPVYLRLLADLTERLTDGRTVLIHCRQGIGRAGLIAIGLLVASGVAFETAIDRVAKARGQPVPETIEQRHWIEEHAKGSFTQAA